MSASSSAQSIAPYQRYKHTNIHIYSIRYTPLKKSTKNNNVVQMFKKLFLVGINYFCKFYLMPNAKKLKQVQGKTKQGLSAEGVIERGRVKGLVFAEAKH